MTPEEISLKLKEARKILSEVLDSLDYELNPNRYQKLADIESGLRRLSFEYHNLSVIEQGESSNENR